MIGNVGSGLDALKHGEASRRTADVALVSASVTGMIARAPTPVDRPHAAERQLTWRRMRPNGIRVTAHLRPVKIYDTSEGRAKHTRANSRRGAERIETELDGQPIQAPCYTWARCTRVSASMGRDTDDAAC